VSLAPGPLLATALENALWVAVLAPCLVLVGRMGAPARGLHAAWILLLLELLAPPLLRIPVPAWPVDAFVAVDGATAGPAAVVGGAGGAALADAATWALALWAAGTLVVLAAAWVRTVRFRAILVAAGPAPAWIVDEATALARELRLATPAVTVVPARMAPCVDGLRRRPRLDRRGAKRGASQIGVQDDP